jgi:hypothetical protein
VIVDIEKGRVIRHSEAPRPGDLPHFAGIYSPSARPRSREGLRPESQDLVTRLLGLEEKMLAAQDALRTAVQAIDADQDLTPKAKGDRRAKAVAGCYASLEKLAEEAVGLAETGLGLRTQVANDAAKRRAERSPVRQQWLSELRQLLAGLSDQRREQVLLDAKQRGDLDVLEAVADMPAVLDKVAGLSGSVEGVTDRAAITEAFERAAFPAKAQWRDEALQIAQAATSHIVHAASRIEEKYQWKVTDSLTQVLGGLTLAVGAETTDLFARRIGANSLDQIKLEHAKELAAQQKAAADASAQQQPKAPMSPADQHREAQFAGMKASAETVLARTAEFDRKNTNACS